MAKGFNIDFVETYDKESLIGELQRLAKVLQKKSLSKKEIDTHGRLSSDVIIKKFGSLRKALQESGLTPSRFTKPTKEELCDILVELWTLTLEKHGRSPFKTELRIFGFPISGDTYVRRFGTWNKALLAAANSVTLDSETSISEVSIVETKPRTGERKSISIRKRFFVFKRDRYRCRICGRSGIELEVDHIVPVVPSRSSCAGGGTDALDNLQTLCFECNRGKRNSFE